jgi:ABC-type nitrate/sulfonate/bicarbonate transport system substrate-binding protein
VQRLAALGLVALAVALSSGVGRADGRIRVDVVVPDRADLQDIAFWVARGAGFFEAEGVEVQIASPEVPSAAVELWQSRRIPAAIFGPAELLELVKVDAPVVLVAGVLDHDALHALCVDRPYVNKHPEVALGMTRAIYRAEKLLHADPLAATNALLMAFPTMDRRRLEESLRTYRTKVPPDPRVSLDDLRASLVHDAGTADADALGHVNLADFVRPSFADEAVASMDARGKKPAPQAPPSAANLAGRVAALAGLACVVIAWLVVTLRRRLARNR